MTAKLVEGLAGSYASMNLRETPLRNYQRAALQRDTAGMSRSLDYASKMNQRIVSYQDITSEGMKEAVEEARKQQQLIQSQALERAQARQNALDVQKENRASLLQSMRYDRVEISSEGKNWLNQRNIENRGMNQRAEESALAERKSIYGLSSLHNAQRVNEVNRSQQNQMNTATRAQAQAGSASRTLYQSNAYLSARQDAIGTMAGTGTSGTRTSVSQRSMGNLRTGSMGTGTMTYGNRMATALQTLYQD